MVPENALAAIPAPAPYEYDARLPDLPPLTGEAKVDLATARRHLAELHRAGASGHTVVRLQAAAMDRLSRQAGADRILDRPAAPSP